MTGEQKFYLGISNSNLINAWFERFKYLEEEALKILEEIKNVNKEISFRKVNLLDELLIFAKIYLEFNKDFPKINEKKLNKLKVEKNVFETQKELIKEKISVEVEPSRKRDLTKRVKNYRKDLEEITKIISKI